MDNAKLLEQFIQQRNRWRQKNSGAGRTDIQILHAQQNFRWLQLIICCFLIKPKLDRFPEWDGWDTFSMMFFSCAVAYLIFVLWKAHEVQGLFERYVFHSAEDVLQLVNTDTGECAANKSSMEPPQK